MTRVLCLGWLLLGAGLARAADESPEVREQKLDFFEKRIRPIFAVYCYECHSGESGKSEGSLVVDTRDGLLKGGDSGPALVAGEPDKSLILKAVRHSDESLKMPPQKKLSSGEISDLETWIRQGAIDPRKAAARKYGMSLDEGRKFWSFQPVKDPPLPAVKNEAWTHNAVDRFVLARMEEANVTPAPAADKRTLLRRVTFDLTGLPPTPGEMESFLADDSPHAFETVVNRLLGSPRYGERWGRHWLDVVRYSDTCGNASDYPIPQAYKYRDWVIAAFNRDMPYDQFLREQLAGDLLPAANETEKYDRTIATGYLAIARRFGGDRMGEFHLTLEDTIDNVGKAMLGCTISCARCHDHKFDPFTMSDYYGLYGIFSSTRYPFPGAEVGKRQEDFVPLMTAEEIEALMKPHREKVAAADAEVKMLEAAEAEAKKATGEDAAKKVVAATKALNEARQRRGALNGAEPVVKTAYAVAESTPANAKLQVRGDPKRPGEEVPRHFPAVLGGNTLPGDARTSGRLQLAEWITDPENPLTARVMVNRLWQYHFGRGLVSTPNDFGTRGQAPTHPALLDYLAARFMESGWSIKSMHRLILLSQTWQLAGTEIAESRRLDPNNELYWRFNRLRLDAESIRDSLLFVSGALDETPPEPHPFPPQHTWGWSQHNPFVANYETRRRSVYLMQQRLRRNAYLALFDGADPSSSTGVRLLSTTPLQALFAMNDPLAHSTSTKFAERIIAAAADDAGRITFAWQAAFGRSPEDEEQKQTLAFFQKYRDKLTALKTPANEVDLKVWSALARSLMSANEFLFVD
ncbi:MAG: PSD1 domain-containing protein [Planctomycetaceae bacterium]|nr:PSD1 domain-containing protein [Planctomycetaceae bacterium]